MTAVEIGLSLRRARVSAGKTVRDASALLQSKGIKATEKTIYSWETGNSQPTPDALLILCHLYEVEDILGWFGYDAQTSFPPDALEIARAYATLPNDGEKNIIRRSLGLPDLKKGTPDAKSVELVAEEQALLKKIKDRQPNGHVLAACGCEAIPNPIAVSDEFMKGFEEAVARDDLKNKGNND